MKTSLQKKINELEREGFVYERDFNTGKHILSEALVKRWVDDDKGGYTSQIKYIENGKIKNY